MISTLNTPGTYSRDILPEHTPGTNIHMVNRWFHVRENKILLDFLFNLKYINFKLVEIIKLNFKEAKNDIFKLTIFSM